MKTKVRPIYHELQGYLFQAPKAEIRSIYNEEAVAVSSQLSGTISELNEITGSNYDKFKAEVFRENPNGVWITTLDINVYRLRLGGLISRLHGEYFFDENPPFSGMPTTIINQSQQQHQSIQMLLEIQSKIDKELQEAPEGSKKRSLLEKVKSSLHSISNVTQLIALIIKTAIELGITTEDLYKIFS